MSQPLPLLVPSPRHIQEFQSLYQKRFGQQIPEEEALTVLMRLLVIVDYKQRAKVFQAQG